MDYSVNSTLIGPCGYNSSNLSAGLSTNFMFSKWFFSKLRIFLYISNPYEEMYQFEQDIPDYHAETLPFLTFFVFLEWFILWYRGKPLPLLAESGASVSMIFNYQCFRLICRGMEHSLYSYVYHNYRIIDLPWDSPHTWYLAAICVDFCYYWGHRASHVVNLLWSHHQAHHNAETYSLVNVFRLPLTQEWLYAFSYIPISLVIPPTAYLIHHQLNLLYQFWIHTTVIDKVGPFEWIFNTPSHHRVHHGSNKYCLDKNFGGWLIIWDRMFGTFQEELPDVPIVYGLVDQVQSFNPLYLQVFYYKKLHDKWQSMDGWKNKLFSLIKGPGWRPGSPWTGFIDEVPDVTSRKMHTPAINTLYFQVPHFFICVLSYEAVNISKDILDPLTLYFHLLNIICGLAAGGMIDDGSPLAPYMEFTRCSILFLFSSSKSQVLAFSLMWLGLSDSYDSSLETAIRLALRSYFFMCSAFWAWKITPITYQRVVKNKML